MVGDEQPTMEEIAGALQRIPPQQSYDDWLKTLMAVHSIYPGAEGVTLIEQWSGGYEGEIAEKFASFREGKVGIGSLFHQAKQNGWHPGTTAPVQPVKTEYKPVKRRAGWDELYYIRFVERTQKTLLDLPEGEMGRRYLTQRGLTATTWVAWGLGFHPLVSLPYTRGQQKRPAVVIPWYRGGKLTAVRFRFLASHSYAIDGRERKAKETSRGTFSGVLYGGHTLPEFCTMPVDTSGKCAEQLRTLILCEGEINAISIWQVAHSWRWDVLSVGSESQKLTSGAIDFAKHYGRVVVWMDKPEIAKSTMAMIPGAYGVSSPMVDGKPLDANDLLQRGQLAELLALARMRACESEVERERFKWDLVDAGDRALWERIQE